MSPPIRDGSGNSIGAIRLGDGTEISEVRTGAGDVLFSPNQAPKRLYSAGPNGVEQYDLNNRFDLTGATQTGTLSGNDVRGVILADNGQKLVTGSRGAGEHRVRDLSTAYDINSAGAITSTLSESNVQGTAIDPTGEHLITASEANSSDTFSYYTMSTPFDLGTASLQTTDNIGGRTIEVDYVNGGEFVFGQDTITDMVRWELSTPYDFQTRFNKQTFTTPTDHRGSFITPDGTKYFSGDTDTSQSEVNEFNLSTPYDIDTRGNSVDTLSSQRPFSLHMV